MVVVNLTNVLIQKVDMCALAVMDSDLKMMAERVQVIDMFDLFSHMETSKRRAVVQLQSSGFTIGVRAGLTPVNTKFCLGHFIHIV